MATQAAKAEEEKQPSELTQRVTGTVHNTREFLKETRAEMSKVTWPTRDDIVATTGVVIATVFFFGVFLWLVDMGVNNGVQYIFRKFGL